MATVITWTKSWSSSDDGTVLGGADLENIQSDVEGHTHTGLATQFTNLDDVDITTPAQGDVVFYDGSNWVALGQDTAGKVLRTEGPSADPTFGYPANLTIASEAEGDILYRNGTVWARLAKGTAGQSLVVNSGEDAPEWSTAKLYRSRDKSTDVTEVTSTGGTYPTQGDVATTFEFYCPDDASGSIYLTAEIAGQSAGHTVYFQIKVESTTTGATVETVTGTTYGRVTVSIPILAAWQGKVVTITPQIMCNYGANISKVFNGASVWYWVD